MIFLIWLSVNRNSQTWTEAFCILKMESVQFVEQMYPFKHYTVSTQKNKLV